MRSLLFVPADSPRKMERSLTLAADVLIFDLEDAVAVSNKAAARDCLAGFLKAHRSQSKQAIYIRVNDLSTGLTLEDLHAGAPFQPDGWVLPKSRNANDVNQLAHYLDMLETVYPRDQKLPARIIAIATENAASIFGMGDYKQASPRLQALMWGAEDLSADVGASTPRNADGQWRATFALARSLCLLAAANAGVFAIDTVPTELNNHAVLEQEAITAKQDGFAAKAAIHPAQVDVINRCFEVSEAERTWAQAVITAFSSGAGVGVLEGRMLDRPHLRLAQRILGMTPGQNG